MVAFLIIIYVTGFMSTLALMKARQAFESIARTPEEIHNQLSDVVHDINGCYSCSGGYKLTDDNEIKSQYPNLIYSDKICEKHNLERYNIEHNVTKLQFVSEEMIWGSIAWPVVLPIAISALVGKYTGNLLYQKNLVNRFEMVRQTEGTEKYLEAANKELDDFIKRVDKGGLTKTS